MACGERLAELFGRRRFAIKPGLERIKALLASLGNPERNFRTIHVAGTNGKGSTGAFLASILASAGYHTALFTSPHLVRYSERFRINGTEIDSTLLDLHISRILEKASPEATFFEMTTAIACSYFAESGVEIAVLEAGMGGKADATAAIPGIATMITGIGLDHCQWLGNSIGEIAAEKAGIAGHDSLVVSHPQRPEALEAIKQDCSINRNRLLMGGNDFFASWTESGMNFTLGSLGLSDVRPGIQGSYQLWNAATAMAGAIAISDTGIPVSSKAITDGIASACWPGRMERFPFGNNVDLLLDGAHNPDGAEALAASILDLPPKGQIILIMGMMEDKDFRGIAGPVAKLARKIITVSPDQERAISAERLAELYAEIGYKATPAGTVKDGLDMAKALARPDDLILATGSLFTVGEVRALLTNSSCEAVRG